MSQKYCVTTPIYYVNDKPHLGHAYTTLCADVLARYHRLKGDEVFFLTGTDEHGAKVQQSAEKAGMTPQEFVDMNAAKFKETWSSLNITNDYFIRTSESGHEHVVKDLFQKLRDNNYIYEKDYEGLYCIGCEKFLQEDDLVEGKCPFHPKDEPVNHKEKNYFFKLSAPELTSYLLKIIENNEFEIYPEGRKNEVLGKIKKGLEDVSVSRAGVTWGVAVPWDKTQTIYVWVDALINYYSATVFTKEGVGYWPANLHLMAKDILWFHAIIWPAMLKAADLPLPKKIAAHGFFTVDGQKMSKSIGNVIDPNDLIKEFGVEATRYLVMAELPFASDGDVSLARFKQRYQSDLANGVGNTFSRLTNMIEKYGIVWPEMSVKEEVKKEIEQFVESLAFNDWLSYLGSRLKLIDQAIEQNAPWQMYKDGKVEEVQKLLGVCTDQLKVIAFYLQPVMPESAAKVYQVLSQEKITKAEPLFPRLNIT